MSSIDQRLSTFLSNRGLDAPDGRPLYAYRCELAEFEDLQRYLTEYLSGAQGGGVFLGPLTSQALCLWAAEWWRRNHEGGMWRWEDMLAAIGGEFLAPGNAGYQRLCAAVATGLRVWKRQLLRTGNVRAFLVTLACEGGLPLRLVTREHAGLRRYFKALLEEIRVLGAAGIPVEQIAERAAGYLSRRLRHDVVYTLCGQLAARVWNLQEFLGPTSTPLADLDRLRPGWRDDLPLRVDDSVARALLNNLLVDASTIARRTSGRIRWTRYLARDGDGWELEGELELPTSLQGREFVALFTPAEGEAPRRFDLCLRSSDAIAEVVALGTAGQGIADAPALRLEPSRAARRRTRGASVVAGRTLIARDGTVQLTSDQFAGSGALSELPWIFECPAEGADLREARLVGEGSTSVRTRSALVALPAGAALMPREGAEAGAEGRVRGLDREVFRLTGTAEVVLPEGASVVVRSGDMSGLGEVEYRLRAAKRLAARTPEPVLLGVPRLLELRDGAAPILIPNHLLQWKPERGATGWCPLSAAAVGDGRIRYVDGGQIRFSSRVKLLPETASVRFLPDRAAGRGVIELSGVRGREIMHVELAGQTSATLCRLPGEELRVELSCAGRIPPTVTLSLVWAQGQRLTLNLPFPASGACFEDHCGSRLPPGGVVSLAMLPGVRATAMVPGEGGTFSLEGTYTGADAVELGASRLRLDVPMEEVSPGHFDLDLGIVRSWVEARLDASTDEEGSIRLEIRGHRGAGVAPRILRVARYDINLVLAADDGVVRLPAESLARLTPDEVESFRLEAFSLRRPDQPRVSLQRISNVSWLLPSIVQNGGAWMIVGWQGDWCRARPCRWNPADIGQALADDLEEAGPEVQDERIAASIRGLAGNTADPEWLVIDGLISWTRYLPPVSFARLRVLASNPEAMAVAALRLADTDFERFWPGMETLPFSWRLVSRAAWDSAVETFIRGFRLEIAALGEAAAFIDDAEALLRERLDAAISRVSQRLRPLGPVLGMARARALGERLTVNENAMLRPEVRYLLLADRQGLLQSSGVDTGDLSGVPRFSEIETLCRALPTHLELEPLWVRKGLQPGDHRFSVANAPVIAALAALGGVRLSRLQLCEMRGIRDRAPDWFDESYDACYLYSLGVVQSARHRDALRSERPVLPVAR